MESIVERKLRPSEERRWMQFYPEGIDKIDIPKMNLYQNYLAHNKDYPNQISLEYLGTTITVKELVKHVEAAKKAFVKAGLKKGQSVSVAMITNPEFVYTLFALNDLGIRIDLWDYVSDIEAVREHQASDTNKIIVINDELYDKFADLIDDKGYERIVHTSLFDSVKEPIKSIKKAGAKRKVKKAGGKLLPDDERVVTLQDFVSLAKNDVPVIGPLYEEGVEAITLYSSGSSTGTPTPYIATNESINSTVNDNENDHMSLRGQTYFNVLPSIYATTISSSLMVPLILGQKVVLDPRYDINLFPKQFKKYKPQHCVVPSGPWQSLLNSDVDLTEGVNYIVGGDHLDEGLEEALNLKIREQHMKKIASVKYKVMKCINKFLGIKGIPGIDLENNDPVRMQKGYGSSPFGACVSYANPKSNIIGSSGIPLPHVTVGIFKPDSDEELDYGSIGEIRVISSARVKSIKGNPDAINEVFKLNSIDGKVWGHSGDIGKLDEDGRLHVLGRRDEAYQEDGIEKYPFQIESILRQCPEILQCKVVRTTLGEGAFKKDVNVAHIKLKPTATTKPSEVLKQAFDLCATVPEIATLDAIKLREDIPYAASGKVANRKLREDRTNLITKLSDGSFSLLFPSGSFEIASRVRDCDLVTLIDTKPDVVKSRRLGAMHNKTA